MEAELLKSSGEMNLQSVDMSVSSVSGIATSRLLEGSGKGQAKVTSPGFFLCCQIASKVPVQN